MAMWREKPKVLVVDDDLDFLSDISVMLSSEFEVTTVANTREAMHNWNSYKPDCVLVDMHMPRFFGDDPKTEGLSFITYMKQNFYDVKVNKTPVIIVSAFAGDETGRQRAGELGIRTMHKKPPDIRLLITSIWDSIARQNL